MLCINCHHLDTDQSDYRLRPLLDDQKEVFTKGEAYSLCYAAILLADKRQLKAACEAVNKCEYIYVHVACIVYNIAYMEYINNTILYSGYISMHESLPVLNIPRLKISDT